MCPWLSLFHAFAELRFQICTARRTPLETVSLAQQTVNFLPVLAEALVSVPCHAGTELNTHQLDARGLAPPSIARPLVKPSTGVPVLLKREVSLANVESVEVG